MGRFGTIIGPEGGDGAVRAAADVFRASKKAVALTGAGISVACGIPDFRSRGGLWEVYRPEEYATLSAFLANPEKVWNFYRALGRILDGKRPGAGHLALARLEEAGRLAGVITQNIDGLHGASGSRRIAEIHGESRNLHCPRCGWRTAAERSLLEAGPVPRCRDCDQPMKPNVVLFGETLRETEIADSLLDGCDCLLVIGTSAEVWPAAEYPLRVASAGGRLMEFNIETTPLSPRCDFLFEGPVEAALPNFANAVLEGG